MNSSITVVTDEEEPRILAKNPNEEISSNEISQALLDYLPAYILTSMDVKNLSREKMDAQDIAQVIKPIVEKNPRAMVRYSGDLAQNLRNLMNFPQMHEAYQTDACAPLNQKIPLPHADVEHKGSFISKESAFINLQNLVMKTHKDKMGNQLTRTFFYGLIRTYVDALGGRPEFVQISNKFNEIEKTVRQSATLPNIRKPFGITRREILTIIKQSYWNWDETKHASILAMLDKQCNRTPPSQNPKLYHKISEDIVKLEELVKSIVNTHPDIFIVSNCQAAFSKTVSSKIGIRVFTDKDKKFVMTEELLQIGYKYETNPEVINTVSLEDVLEKVSKLPERTRNRIELIKVPIVRIENRALPIQQPNGGHCKLAADLFEEIHNDMLDSLNFANITDTAANSRVAKIDSEFKKTFPDTERIYFVKNYRQKREAQQLKISTYILQRTGQKCEKSQDALFSVHADSKRKEKKNSNKNQNANEKTVSKTGNVTASSVGLSKSPAHPSIPITQTKEYKDLYGKCTRVTDRCNTATANLESANKQVEKLAKRVAVLEGREEGKKPRDVLEKELEESLRKNRELEEQVQRLTELQNTYESRLLELDPAVDRLTLQLKEANEIIGQKEKQIRQLKSHVPKETRDALKADREVRLTKEMSRLFGQFQDAKDVLCTDKSFRDAQLKLMKLSIDPSTLPNHETLKEAELAMVIFREKYDEHERNINSGLATIRDDMFITMQEAPTLSEMPVVSDVLDRALAEIREAKNARIHRQCCYCTSEEDNGEWVYCPHPGCGKRQHLDCVKPWWKKQGEKTCLECTKTLE